MRLKLLDGIYCALSYKMHGGHPGILPDDTRTLMSLTLALYVFDVALFFGLVLEVLPIILVFLITYVLGPIVAIIWYFYIKRNRNRIFEESYRYNTKGYRILSVLFIALALCSPYLCCLLKEHLTN